MSNEISRRRATITLRSDGTWLIVSLTKYSPPPIVVEGSSVVEVAKREFSHLPAGRKLTACHWTLRDGEVQQWFVVV